jgi:hypothetical protein
VKPSAAENQGEQYGKRLGSFHNTKL